MNASVLHRGLAVLCILGLGAGLAGCAQEPPTIRLLNNSQEPTLLFEGFHMISTQRGEREWDFFARAAQIFEHQNLARAQDIKVDYWRGGKVVSSLTAQRGFLQTETHHLRAEKNVVMVSAQGDVLRTELLQWDNVQHRIYTDAPVTVERKNNILTGVGLEADNELQHIEVLSQVKIRVRSVKTLATQTAPSVPARR